MSDRKTLQCSFGVPVDKAPVDLVRLNTWSEIYASYETLMEWNSQGLPIYEMGRRMSFASIKETEDFIRKRATVKVGQP